MQVPFVDLHAQYLDIKPQIDAAIKSVIEETAFIGGKYVKDFETDFAALYGIKNVISCANGTDSIEILLEAYGIGAGDEVIVPALSWISTSEAVSRIGAIPVFVDIEPEYYTINTALIEQAITPKTKAIIPVHLYGHPADMETVMKMAAAHNLIVIEDCAQSHMAAINGRLAGTIGHAASFSFYPGKNLGAYGDAGCMATNDDAIATTARMIANHGQKKKHDHVIEGRNSRLDGLQAAIIAAKIPYVDKWTNGRISNADKYDKYITTQAVQKPITRQGAKHVFHLYVIRCANREKLQQTLKEKGIDTAVHYPTALPFLACYNQRGFNATDFPVAHKYQHEILSIPMFPELSEEMIAYVANAINSAN